MNQKLEHLQLLLKDLLGARIIGSDYASNELTVEVSAENYHAVMMQLRDDPAFCFEQLVGLHQPYIRFLIGIYPLHFPNRFFLQHFVCVA